MRRQPALALLALLTACVVGKQDRTPSDGAAASSSASSAQHPASDSGYFALRDSASRSLDLRAVQNDTTVGRADSLALLDVGRYIRRLIGPVYVPGFDATGRNSLATLFSGDEDSGLADGLVFESTDRHARLFVTTQTLFAAWVRARFAKDTTATRDPIAALSREETYTPIFGSDAAVVRYADLPVAVRGKRVLAAMLVVREQDDCLTCRPGTMLVGVRAGRRIFVVEAAARDTIDVPARCRSLASTDGRAAGAVAASQGGGGKDSARDVRFTDAEDRRFDRLRQCYDSAIRDDPRFAELVAQARALVEALPRR